MSTEVKCWCRHCKAELAPSHTGPCPDCGKTGKNCSVKIHATVGIKTSLSMEHRHTYIELGQKKVKAIIAAIIIDLLIAALSTIIGFMVGGGVGAIIGFFIALVLAVIIHVVFKRTAKTLVREITRYK